MRIPGFSKLELRILEVLWTRGRVAIRQIQEALPKPRPAYSTVQTMVYRLEKKRAVRRVRKIGNAHIFEAAITRQEAHRGPIDYVLSLFGGRIQPVMAHWAESGASREELADAEKLLRELAAKKRVRT